MIVASYILQMYIAWKLIRNFQFVMDFFFKICSYLGSCVFTNSYVNSPKHCTISDNKIMYMKCFERFLARDSKTNSI